MISRYRSYKITSRGFTIVELVVVIVVIAILATLMTVTYTTIKKRSYDKSVTADMMEVANSLEAYRSVAGKYPSTYAQLENMPATAVEATISVNKSAYELKSDDVTRSGLTNNFVFCVAANDSFALAAVAKSGNVLSLSSKTPKHTDTNKFTWSTALGTVCSRLGYSSSQMSATDFVSEYYYSRSTSNTNYDAGWGNWRRT